MSNSEWHSWQLARRPRPNPQFSSYAERPVRDERPPRPQVAEDVLKTAEIQVERKRFVVVLKENERGRFLRITEEGSVKRDSIMIPATGLEDFGKLLSEMVAESAKTPTPNVAQT